MTITKLIQAIERGAIDEVTAELRRTPSLVSATTADGDTLLHIACWQKKEAIVEALLARGAAVDARGCYGRTPLHYAVHEGKAASVPIVRRLVEQGADPSIRDANGFTVEAWARQEMWGDALDAVLPLLKKSRPPALRLVPSSKPRAAPSSKGEVAGDDFASVTAQVKSIESRSHTALALSRMLTAFRDGSTWDARHTARDLPSADARCLEDAQKVLDAIDESSWAAPFREWIHEAGSPAEVHRLIERYEQSRNAG
ncbi:inversin protein alternative isoform, putative [Minicystis rosea]|nr:inversin protein alternative isoform, putative [Minicystis rosea]